ncbi:MAG: rhamnulokinase [Lachnospiraceae bacterium]|jgi:rhamnulokinase|nr:rhamnulokinase [Lachnospiraceae bacterium]MCI1398619.1 rhamnulokinase [Lachnospiraceae bacterium]MCI1424763.1 rhamnulokinase [Lachnospiraceae bacterium]MCI1453478.1 rhamnulokinase [Lachnospiraceae bacterium]
MAQTQYFLAVDIGASSGRHMLSHMEDGKIVLEEMYRFPNGNEIIEKGGRRCRTWNTKQLFAEILNGMKACKAAGKIPVSMGIDTWAVDYVLLDENDEPVGPCYAYRDDRTKGMDARVYETISERDLYARTGIQKAIFNTIYQMEADKVSPDQPLSRAKTLLMVPDYFHFLLTGVKKQEYTNATTTQLVSPKTRDWDQELISMLGFPQEIFQEISLPGTVVADHLLPAVREAVGFDTSVVLPATHDTGSAVMSVPSQSDDCLYISSGTWSLMGCERKDADCSQKAQEANFTNEGGYDYRYRFLKNIMGLWMIQSVKKELEAGYDFPGRTGKEDYGFGSLCDKAKDAGIASLVPANDVRFLAPESMIAEVQNACRESGQQVPQTPWEIARVIYRSLAACYKEAAEEIEAITGKKFDAIHIVGGGSNAVWLNELTAKVTGKTVLAGPGEATAIGNIGAQMIQAGVFPDLKAFRKSVETSFDVKTYRA